MVLPVLIFIDFLLTTWQFHQTTQINKKKVLSIWIKHTTISWLPDHWFQWIILPAKKMFFVLLNINTKTSPYTYISELQVILFDKILKQVMQLFYMRLWMYIFFLITITIMPCPSLSCNYTLWDLPAWNKEKVVKGLLKILCNNSSGSGLMVNGVPPPF